MRGLYTIYGKNMNFKIAITLFGAVSIFSIAAVAQNSTVYKKSEKSVSHGFDRGTVDGADKYYQFCIGQGDLECALQAFEPGATYVGQDKVYHGLSEIRSGLAPIVAMKAKISGGNRVVYSSGNIAATIVEWHLEATTPDGKALDFRGQSSDVWRKGKDGIYRYLVDNAMGVKMLPPAVAK